MADRSEAVREMLREVLAPLIEADGGFLYLVAIDKKKVAVHLGGLCSGCPGTPIASRNIIEPAIKALAPRMKIEITTGWQVPDGAERVTAA